MEEPRHPISDIDYPGTFQDFDKWFSSENDCLEYIATLRWPQGFVCPGCGEKSENPSLLVIASGEMGSVETLLFIGIWGCIAGTMFILYGFRLRQLAFPLLILLFIVPLPPFIDRMLTFNLKMTASTLSVIMMRMVGLSVFQEGNIIDLGNSTTSGGGCV
jgi:hypothetical protein